jgi:3-methyladenine DNA glycosylase AlkC
MGETQPFKNYYGPALAQLLSEKLMAQDRAFKGESFYEYVTARCEPLELKGRVKLIRDGLHAHLPMPYPAQIEMLLSILGEELNPAHEHGGMFNEGYWVMPIAAFVQEYGLEHFDESVRALYEITKRFSSEEAIRPYLVRYTDRLMPTLYQWTTDPSMHVRRLVSEGTRPRLPWAMQLKMFIDDPTPLFGLLERLKDDPASYVRRSVANNLNDIAKDHPAWVVQTLTGWHDGASEGTRYIIRHALRHLVKQGNRDALALLGFQAEHAIEVTSFTVDQERAAIGENVTLKATLHNPSDSAHDTVIDYVVHYVKATGKTSPKVFKWATARLAPGETLNLIKKHAFRDVSIRTHHVGVHRIGVQVNGMIAAEASVSLTR